MDYENFILQNYTISVSDLTNANFLYLYSDGSYELVADTDFNEASYNTLELLMSYSANYSNRFLVGNTRKSLISVGYNFQYGNANGGDLLVMNTNKLEYMIYGSSNGGNTMYASYNDTNDTIDDLSSIDNYYKYASRENISDVLGEENNYGGFFLSNFTYCVFDYSNLKDFRDGDSFYTIRGENTAFYKVVNEFYYSPNSQNIYFSYGAPTYSEYQRGFQTGYNDGFTGGWVQGNENGYILGQNSNGIEQNTATAFDYIGGAFGAVGNIMSLEVLPHITLGTAFTIPMVFVLIMTIFKLVRK